MGSTKYAQRRLLHVLAAAVLGFSTAQSAAAQSLDPRTLANALEYRRTFGLSEDLATVTSLELSPSTNRKYSVALSPDEVAEMDKRMATQELLVPLLEYGRDNRSTFGGMYVDQAAGGIVNFGFTSEVSSHRENLMRLAPTGVEVEVRIVPRTEDELDELVERVSRDLEFDASIGASVHNTGTNVIENTVEIYVEPFSSAIVDAYQRQYGPAVVVLPGSAPSVTACYTRDNCPGPPIMAGVSNDWGCTVGFGIWMDGKRRFLTAGHCVQGVVDAYGWTGWEWFHQSVSLGLSTDESWFDYSPADAGSMGNVSSTVHSNRVLYSTQPSWFGIHSAQGAGSDWTGMAVCQSGQTSGYRCGTISTTNATPCYDPTPPCGGSDAVHMKWQRKANYLVQVGDSGAPVISQSNTNMAVGLQSGRDSLYVAYYSHIAYVLAPNGANGGIGAAIWTYDS